VAWALKTFVRRLRQRPVRPICHLSVTLSAGLARLAIKGAGDGQIGAAAVLLRELQTLHGALSSARLQVVEWLSLRKVAMTVRTASRPA
jgi:hypothetical protein